MGGMRYIPSSQIFVTSLIDQLGLAQRDFPMGNPNPAIGQNNNLLYLRRHHLRFGDLSYSDKVPYTVRSSEQNMSPTQLETYLLNSLVPQAAKLTLKDWFQVKVL